MVSGGTGIAGFTVTDCFRFTKSPEFILRGSWVWSGTLSPIYGPHRGRPHIRDPGSATFRRIEGRFRGRVIKTKNPSPPARWSLTRCATNCATSRGPFFKGIANIGILFRKNKRRASYFSEGGVDRVSWRAFRADLRAEAARRRRTGPLTTAKVFRSSFSSSGVKLG